MNSTIKKIIVTGFSLIFVFSIITAETNITAVATQIEPAASYTGTASFTMLSLPKLENKTVIETNNGSLNIMQSMVDSRKLISDQLKGSYNATIEKQKDMAAKSLSIENAITRYNYDNTVAKAKQDLMDQRIQELGLDTLTDTDINNLLRIVQAEAGVCDLEGKMVVANVILNRVRSNRFPNTITGVIFAPRQFSPVSNGRFYSCKVTDETKEAVERVLNGEDNSQGALFFMNRSASRGGAVGWFDSSLTFLFSKGGHDYFK